MLANCDTDGMNIVRCYQYCNDPIIRDRLFVNPGIRWLGIKTDQLLNLVSVAARGERTRANTSCESSTTFATVSIASTECRSPISKISQRDRKVAKNILSKLVQASLIDDEALDMVREMQVMLMLGVKCEIQWLDEAGDITSWLDHALSGATRSLER